LSNNHSPALDPVLAEGMRVLCRNDRDIDALVAPRQHEVLSLLGQYIAEIELFNPAYGLVGTADRRELIIKHILDSLAPLGIISRLLADQDAAAADVGSGAGLPGIPLAIALPRIRFTLIERMGRRAGFLRNTQAALALSNLEVEEAAMEQAAPGRFSLITFRAFRPLEPKMLKGLFRLCASGGVLAAYKGRREKIEEELAALGQLAQSREIIPCPAPLLDEERHLLLIKSC
jgi:16S rRNA (guanine527-N7)-methyltransferase